MITNVLGEAGREGKTGKGDQPYEERWKLNFWWSACYSVRRVEIKGCPRETYIMLYANVAQIKSN